MTWTEHAARQAPYAPPSFPAHWGVGPQGHATEVTDSLAEAGGAGAARTASSLSAVAPLHADSTPVGPHAGLEAPGDATPRWQPSMLLVGTSDEDDAAVVHPHLRTLPVLGAVVRRVIPTLVEATVIPALLVYGFVALGSLTLAMVSALAWTGGILAWRRLTRRSIPGVLLLAAAGLTVRTVVGISSGNPIVYFMQPIATTMALAVVFLGTLLTDRPIIARLAVDFCPLSPEVAVRPAVVQLFRELTVMWAAVHVANAAATFALLMSVPTATFIATKTVTCVGISSCAVVVTVMRSLGIARRERLAFVPAG